ncbi:hypothetical protein FVP60_02045 [Microbacterium mitrae]|uniref:Uncharacterized protein n=1 Tax=Microbacterium mitrae TaxID=664640 RepID=A0A5C8HRV8_9MICO|nr:hypothetical protein [Microbacterium mitrae]TXK05793.1 hypothetical protein FVP60_02045 [Microbacterium mitrae]
MVENPLAMPQRNDTRFRLVLFADATLEVTAYDISGASLEFALDAARQLSRHDEVMWALAVVDQESAVEPALLWISGSDYSQTPKTPNQWRHRRDMQDRYLMAKSRRRLPLLLPDGRRSIRMFAEWGRLWGLWESFSESYVLDPSSLGLSAELGDELYAWNDAFNDREVDDPLPSSWRDEGLALYDRLQRELAGVAEVRPEFLL